jgi:hypothetical protein
MPVTPKVRTNFWLDDQQREGLRIVRSRTGISEADQIRRGIQMWLESQGLGGKMPSAQVLERLDGTAKVFREGKLLRPMRYHITIWQEMHDGGGFGQQHDPIAGLKRIEGRVDLDDREAFDLVGVELTMTIEDGRTLEFFVRSSDGEIANRGPKGLS